MAHPLIAKLTAYYGKMKKSERMLLYIAITTVFIGFMLLAVLEPIFSQLKMLDAQIKAKTQSIMRNRRYLSRRDSIIKEYSKYSNYLEYGEKTEEQIIAEHLQEIEKIANAQQVSIIKIDSADKRKNPLNKEYDINVDCEATLGNMLAFMNSLEDSEFLFQVKKYKLSPKSKEGDSIKGSITITREVINSETVADLEKKL